MNNPLIDDQLLSLMKEIDNMPCLRFLRMPLTEARCPEYPCGFVHRIGKKWLSLPSQPIKSRVAWLWSLSGIPPKNETGIIIVKDKPEMRCSKQFEQKIGIFKQFLVSAFY